MEKRKGENKKIEGPDGVYKIHGPDTDFSSTLTEQDIGSL